MTKLRYRREVIPETLLCEYRAEYWEPYEAVEQSTQILRKGLRLVSMEETIYQYPLTGWEREAAINGWEPPGHFTYHDKLPDSK